MGFGGWVWWGRCRSRVLKNLPYTNSHHVIALDPRPTEVDHSRRGCQNMAALLAAVEATLRGRDERLVAKCDVPGILAVFERWGMYDVDTLQANLESSFAQLQSELAPVAALSFPGLLKATIATTPPPPPSGTPFSAPPTTPFTHPRPFSSPPLHPSPPPTVPLVVTIKMNNKVVAERTTMPVPPDATWEAVARVRLESVLDAAEVQGCMSTPLSVSLFPTADHSSSDRVSAALSDTVAGGFALGYPHVLFTLSPPVYGCARPAARGVDAPARMMADAAKQVRQHQPTHTRAAHSQARPRARRHSHAPPAYVHTSINPGGVHRAAGPLPTQGGGRPARL